MTTIEIMPYYVCFCNWFQFVHPLSYLSYVQGNLDTAALTPFIREWAEDITTKKSDEN